MAAPAGWSCSKITNGNRQASFRCTTASLAAGATAGFTVKANTRPVPASGQLQLQGVISSASADADPDNNTGSYSAGY